MGATGTGDGDSVGITTGSTVGSGVSVGDGVGVGSTAIPAGDGAEKIGALSASDGLAGRAHARTVPAATATSATDAAMVDTVALVEAVAADAADDVEESSEGFGDEVFCAERVGMT